MPVRTLSHFGICVADPKRSIHFYRDLLGFELVSHLQVDDPASAKLIGLDPLELHSTFLERDGARIELLHYVSPGHEPDEVPRPMNRQGLTHMAMRVDDLASLLVELQAAGVEILEESRIQNPAFQSDVVYVLDPDGVRIELIQLPGDPTQAVGQPFDG
ncbi:MAG: VOC family protein [Deltaproteobacteria bacterium]|nr:VOC family protein [Deltaproteobacteria bacterium]